VGRFRREAGGERVHHGCGGDLQSAQEVGERGRGRRAQSRRGCHAAANRNAAAAAAPSVTICFHRCWRYGLQAAGRAGDMLNARQGVHAAGGRACVRAAWLPCAPCLRPAPASRRCAGRPAAGRRRPTALPLGCSAAAGPEGGGVRHSHVALAQHPQSKKLPIC
jgi:hypothetical protein